MTKRKHPAISVHQTLTGQLNVDWRKDYNNEFICPDCETEKLTQLVFSNNSLCQLVLKCKSCGKKAGKSTSLTCSVQGHIFRYCSDRECPNPLCNKIGPDGQKGWLYIINYFLFKKLSQDGIDWRAKNTYIVCLN